MAADKLIQAEQQLQALSVTFKQKLPGRFAELRSAASGLTPEATEQQTLQALSELGLLAHRLAGSAGTFGFTDLGVAARHLEGLCGTTSDVCETLRTDILEALQRLERQIESNTADPIQADPTRNFPTPTLIPKPTGRRILLVEDDPALAQQLTSVLPNFGFEVEWLEHPRGLAQALARTPPDVLLMDIVYPDGRDTGVSAVKALRESGQLICPVIFVSVRDDFEARLQAARIGSHGYLPKPLDIPDLLDSLRHFIERAQEKPFRVLTVEDDEDLLVWYRQVLRGADFEVETLSDPRRAMEILRKFHPDVILMDIEMPSCNGLELASVIRQHVDYLQIPIVFITGHANHGNRLDAWRSGGDDFMSKPVQPEILIPSLRARAEKSRALVSLSVHQKVKASRARFHALASVSPVATLYTDPEGLCLFVNARFSSMTGSDAEAAFGKHWTYWIYPEDRPDVMAAWLTCRDTGTDFEAEFRLAAEQEPLWVIGRTSAQLDEDGQIAGYAATLTDIAEIKRSNQALAQAKQMLETTFASIQDAVLVVDTQTARILQSNPSVESILGYRCTEIEGIPLAELFSDAAEYRRYAQRMHEALNEYAVFRTDVRMQGKGASQLLAEHTVTPLNRDQQPSAVVTVIRDVTVPRALTEKLAYQSTHDTLTGLLNRFEFEHRMAFALEQANREGTASVVCYLDLDRFKLINDTCGHAAGDRVLREISGILSASIRQMDTLARLGGDEFAVLMEKCTLQQAHRVAVALLRAVEHYRFTWEGQLFSLSVSMGLVAVDQYSGDISDVLKAADSACYAAKEGGRNRIHVFREDDEKLLRHHTEAHWGMLIEQALEGKGFELFYQPIVSLAGADGVGLHFECLLRMLDESGGLVRPGSFLLAAEHFHLSSRIDRWVVGKTLDRLRGDAAGLRRVTLCSINLSGQSLGDERFLEFVLECFTQSGVSPDKICFEITETAAISNIEQAQHFISQLKQIGCYFALDDFGTGVSSFAYLKNLPVDYLKIDGSFIKDILQDPLDQAMVKSINEIGHVLGKLTIAEYVENEAILQRLIEIGVDYAQGFHTGRPAALRDLPSPKS
ncbi:MAG: EAL domain-containing protein [Gammaproteobacteria bacterium]|nr:EAL domain-containing protein [Gammaproteobacteria bacterium]